MLSLPDSWDFTLRGLASINKENLDAIRTAVLELEKHGYITRRQMRNSSGKLAKIEYTIYEQPQQASSLSPHLGKPCLENPNTVNPNTEKPNTDIPTQLNTKQQNTEKSITDISNPHQSIYPASGRAPASSTEMDRDRIDINLKIPEGKFTALVGPSGGGKSTIARLIARFWDVNDGKITIGGVDIRSMPLAQLADIVSFVTQDNFLFNCSIKENIRLGNPDATDEEVYTAAKAACCDEFIQKLDNGYDTIAGDAGNRLSGGEKQRISIARMILKNAPIVILDEATAFTDQENEEKIQQSIAALTKGKTLLVIAHRLSTIKNADQIIVLQNGQVENTGTHQQLLDGDSLYRDMWEAHIGAQNWSAGSGKGGN